MSEQRRPEDEHLRRARRLQLVLDELLEATDQLVELLLQELHEVWHPSEERPKRPKPQ